MTAKKKTDQFEEALKKLEKIVEKLEQGNLPLEEAMESFTEGVRLAKLCNERLDEAEDRLQKLVKNDAGSWTTSTFDPSRKEDGNESDAAANRTSET